MSACQPQAHVNVRIQRRDSTQSVSKLSLLRFKRGAQDVNNGLQDFSCLFIAGAIMAASMPFGPGARSSLDRESPESAPAPRCNCADEVFVQCNLPPPRGARPAASPDQPQALVLSDRTRVRCRDSPKTAWFGRSSIHRSISCGYSPPRTIGEAQG
jgi:hypothetical protein